MKKVLCKIAVIVLLVLLCAVPATADKIDLTPTDRFFVNDFADVMDSETENALFAAGVQLYEKTKAQVVVVTVDTIGGADIHDYGVQLGRAWGIGDKEKNTGVLLLLAVQDRQVDISVGYGLEGAITDAKSGIILDNYAVPYFQDNDFSAGLAATYDALVNEVYIEFGLEPDPNYTPADELANNNWFPVIFLVLVFLLIVFGSGRRGGSFFFFPIGGFGHYHHRGGGGFGGFGGGGGFRGGGGSFGGGGSSRGF
ncbi:MAG: TPM domain-containing protein [Clostridia bacterium]|nr:TPM domain-containing protein [Clostridia bacterium]